MIRNRVVHCLTAIGVVVGMFITGQAEAQVLDKPVAVVRFESTVNIGQRELRRQVEFIEEQIRRPLTKQHRKEVLEAKIAEVLILQAAERDGIEISRGELQQGIDQQRRSVNQQLSEEQFRRLIEREMDMEWDDYVEEVRQRLIQERYVLESRRELFENVESPSEREIRRVYEENASEFMNPAMIRFNHIFLDTRNVDGSTREARREKAHELWSKIESEEKTFEVLMRAADDDTTYSAGDFGYLLRGEYQNLSVLGQGFIDEMFDLDEGDVHGVVESNAGYHIVQVRDRRRARVLDLDDPLFPGQNVTVRHQIENYLMMERQQDLFQRALQEVVEELRAEADVTLHEDNLDW